MKAKPINQKVAQKYADFLNSMVSDLKIPVRKREHISEKHKRYMVNTNIHLIAHKLGLLQNVSRGVYKPTKLVYTIDDGIAILVETRNLYGGEKEPIGVQNIAVQQTIEPKIVEKPKEDFKPKGVRSVSFKPTPLRVFSLFWGLIKFNY